VANKKLLKKPQWDTALARSRLVAFFPKRSWLRRSHAV